MTRSQRTSQQSSLPSYEHTERISALPWFFVVLATFSLGAQAMTEHHLTFNSVVLLGILGGLALPVLILSSMTTQIKSGVLSVWLGPGLLRRLYPASGIQAMNLSEVGVLAGFGIRMVPGGWLYRIGGHMALDLLFRDGQRLMIASDDLDGLQSALMGIG